MATSTRGSPPGLRRLRRHHPGGAGLAAGRGGRPQVARADARRDDPGGGAGVPGAAGAHGRRARARGAPGARPRRRGHAAALAERALLKGLGGGCPGADRRVRHGGRGGRRSRCRGWWSAMLSDGVIMDVIDAEQARSAEDAGACAGMALKRSWRRRHLLFLEPGGVAWMTEAARRSTGIRSRSRSRPEAKARIGHLVEAQVLIGLGVTTVTQSEALTPADEFADDAEKPRWMPRCAARRPLRLAPGDAARRALRCSAEWRGGTGDVVADRARHAAPIPASAAGSPSARRRRAACRAAKNHRAPRPGAGGVRREGPAGRAAGRGAAKD